MEPIIENDIFRFMALRPPDEADPTHEELYFIRDPRITLIGTEIGDPIFGLYELSPDAHLDRIEQFAADSYFYTIETNENYQKLLEVYNKAYALTAKTFSALETMIFQILDRSAIAFIYEQEASGDDLFCRIWDSYYISYLRSLYGAQNMEPMTKVLRSYHLLYLVAGQKVNKFTTFEKILEATPLLDTLLTDIPRPELIPAQPSKPALNIVAQAQYTALWNKLIDENRAIMEIRNLRFDIEEITEIVYDPAPLKYQEPTIAVNNEESDQEKEEPSEAELLYAQRLQLIIDQLAKDGIEVDKAQLAAIEAALAYEPEKRIEAVKTISVVNAESYNSMHPRTRQLLSSIGMNEQNVSVEEALRSFENKMSGTISEIMGQTDYNFLKLMPTEAASITSLRSVIRNLESRLKTEKLPVNYKSDSVLTRLGVADLKVVKMRLKKYQAGEIAYIENVLKGEFKERTHRVLERAETMFTTSLELSEEQSKDLQTNERLAIKTEAEKTVEEMLKFDGGGKFTYKNGGVQVELSANVGWQKTSKEASKMSTDYAREVIEKASSRLSKKIKEERVTKNLRETEEKNTHTINNMDKDSKHVVGIYRWVDSLYEARLCNYGKRYMLQFTIPEPSAFYEYAKRVFEQKLKSKAMDELEGPGDFTIKSPAEITENNYMVFVKQYGAGCVEPPPAPYQYVSLSIESTECNSDEATIFKTVANNNMKVPDGYIADLRGASYNFTHGLRFAGDGKNGKDWKNAAYSVTIGSYQTGSMYWQGGDSSNHSRHLTSTQNNKIYYAEGPTTIPLTVQTREIAGFTFSVTVQCTRSQKTLDEWKLKTFSAIRQAYMDQKLAYEQKLAEQRERGEQVVGESLVITGLNPAINREIERTELKHQCIRILINWCEGAKHGSFNAAPEKPAPEEPPYYGPLSVSAGNDDSEDEYVEFDPLQAKRDGEYIQFFEQAFEWENMTFIYYPYFWANRSLWESKSMTFDDDPLFTKFLQAGAARVVLPAREGYEKVVKYYLRTGKIWKGGTVPLADDPLYIAIADELRFQTDEYEDENKEPITWEVVIPTTQIYLQQDSVPLPVFEDPKPDKPKDPDPEPDKPDPDPDKPDPKPDPDKPDPKPDPDKPDPDKPDPKPDPDKPDPKPDPVKPDPKPDPVKPDPKPTTGFKVNDIVNFTGGGVYVSSTTTAKAAATRGESRCKITQISNGAKYPYHLISEDKVGVWGWVAAANVKAIDNW